MCSGRSAAAPSEEDPTSDLRSQERLNAAPILGLTIKLFLPGNDAAVASIDRELGASSDQRAKVLQRLEGLTSSVCRSRGPRPSRKLHVVVQGPLVTRPDIVATRRAIQAAARNREAAARGETPDGWLLR